MPAGVAALAVNASDPEGFVSDAAYFSCRPIGRPLTDTSAVSLVEVMLMGTTTCVPSCGTTTVETGSETMIGIGTIMEPPPQLHPPAAKANPTKATPQARPLDRNMECMKKPASTYTSRSLYSAKHKIMLKCSEDNSYRSSSSCRLRL